MKIKAWLFILAVCLLCANPTVLKAEYWKKITNLPANVSRGAYWLDIYFLESNPRYGWICGQNTNQILRTTNGGNTWNVSTLPTNGRFFESIHFADELHGFCSGPGGVFRTNDGGVSWQPITELNTMLANGDVRFWGCYMLSASTIYIVGGGCSPLLSQDPDPRSVLRSFDGGNTWDIYFLDYMPLPPNGTRNYISSLADIIVWPDGTGFISGGGIIYKTENFGARWRILSRSNTDLYWQEEITNIHGTDIICVPYSESNSCSGGSGPGGGMLWTDDGTTWHKQYINANMYGSFLVSDSVGWGCGSGTAVYRTTTAGRSWQLTNCGIDKDDDLDDIRFVDADNGWVVGSNIYKLAPTEVYAEKKNIDLGNICLSQTLRDVNQIHVKTFNDSYFELNVIQENPHFQIVSPMQNDIYLSACESSELIVEFAPASTELADMLGRHEFAVEIIGTVYNEAIDFRDTVYYTINVSEYDIETDKDTLDLGVISLNGTANGTVKWTTKAGATVKLDSKNGNDINNYCQLQLPAVDWELSTSQENEMHFTVTPSAAGEYFAKYTFWVLPCNVQKDIYVKFQVLPVILETQQNYDVDMICKSDTVLAIPVFNNGTIPIAISDIQHKNATALHVLGFGKTLQQPSFVLQPTQVDTMFVQITSQSKQNFTDTITLSISDTGNVTATLPFAISVNVQFLNPSVTNQTTVLDFGDVCVNTTANKQATINYDGNIAVALAQTGLSQKTLRLISNQITAAQPDSVLLFDINFTPSDTGFISDTIHFTTEPCNYNFDLIVIGNGVKNEFEYSPASIDEIVGIGEERQFVVSVKSTSGAPIRTGYNSIVPPLAEVELEYYPPTEEEIPFHITAYSDVEKVVTCSLQIIIEGAAACADTIWIPITVRFVANQIAFKNSAGIGINSVSNTQQCDFVQTFDTIFINAANNFILHNAIFTNNLPEFKIESVLNFPINITAKSPYPIIISTTQNALGNVSDELVFELESVLSGTVQFDTISINSNFTKSNLSLSKTDFDFGMFETCNIPIYHTLKIANAGNIADTCYIDTTGLPNCITFSDTKIIVEANDSAVVTITCEPNLTTPITNYFDSVQFYSTVCHYEWTLNLKYHSDSIALQISPGDIDLGEGWANSLQTTTFTLSNPSPFDIDITDIIVDEIVGFSVKMDVPFTLATGASIEIPVEFISDVAGLFSSKINILASRQCSLAVEIPITISIPEEKYYATIEWNKVKAAPGDTVTLEATVINASQPDFYPTALDLNIKMNYKLFYPMKLFVINNDNVFEEIGFDFDLNTGVSARIEAKQARNLLNFQRAILKLEGKVLLANVTETPVWFDSIRLETDKSVSISLLEGQLELLEFCPANELQGDLVFAPTFEARIENQIVQEVLNVEFNVTGDIAVNYDIVDLIGNKVLSDKINLNKGMTEADIKLNSLVTGTYFIKFFADFNYPVSECIIISK